MKNAELNIVLFDEHDVITTSTGCTISSHWGTNHLLVTHTTDYLEAKVYKCDSANGALNEPFIVYPSGFEGTPEEGSWYIYDSEKNLYVLVNCVNSQ